MNGLTLTIQSPHGIVPEQRLVGPLPQGERGTEATIAAMTALIRESSKGPLVQNIGRHLASAGRDYYVGVFNWLRRAVKFQEDPAGLEFLRHPERIVADYLRSLGTSRRPVADCDDVADLGCALLLAGGAKPVLVVVAKTIDGPFVHVYFGVRTQGGGYVPLDPQELARPGIEVPGARRRVFDVT